MNRIDKLLVDLGYVDTRNKAQLLIEEGVVYVDDIQILKPSFKTDSQNIKITKDIVYVGRGAHKIEGALIDFSFNVNDLVVADVGASTGGFTEYVLSKGAKRVFAIDVGHDQLAMKLRNDPRVVNLEGINIRELNEIEELCDLAVVDLSFISIKLVLENIMNLLKPNAHAIILIKPQFEVGQKYLNKKGVCTDFDAIKNSMIDIMNFASKKNFYLENISVCKIKGRTGNQEFFFFFNKNLTSSKIGASQIESLVESLK